MTDHHQLEEEEDLLSDVEKNELATHFYKTDVNVSTQKQDI